MIASEKKQQRQITNYNNDKKNLSRLRSNCVLKKKKEIFDNIPVVVASTIIQNLVYIFL